MFCSDIRLFLSSNTMNLGQTVKKVIPVVTYGLVIYFIYLYKVSETVSTIEMVLKNFITSGTIYYHFWYVYVYIALVLLLPLINSGINQLSKKQIIYLLCALYAITSIFPSINQFSHDYWFPDALINNRLLLFITLYIQGAYFRRYGVNLTRIVSGTLYLLLMLSVSMLIWSYSKTENAFSTIYYDYSNIFVVSASVMLFCFFAKLDVKYNRVINFLATKTYGAYLIHTVGIAFIQQYLPSISPFINTESYLNPIYTMLYIIAVIVFSFGCEVLRQVFAKMIKKRIS